MQERYTNLHKLDNLIWVWNAPGAEYYPGDDVVDIISRDMYPPAHCHTGRKEEYEELVQITDQKKIVLIGEIGSLPSINAIVEEGVGWASYMTWSHGFCLGEEFNSYEVLRETYHSPYAVTKEELPVLY